MHVDRTKFLLLATAIATACGARRPEPAVATNGPDFDTTQSNSSGPAPVVTNQLATDEPVPPPVEEQVTPAPTVESAPIEAPPPPPVLVTNDSVDPRLAKICDALRAPGPTCESFASVVAACRHNGSVMEPRAAEAAAKCLAKRSNTSGICAFDVSARCAAEGLKSAPLAPGAAQSCTNILQFCDRSGRRHGGDLTRASCRAALSGYKVSVQRSLVECMTRSCEVGVCFQQVHE